MSKLCKLFSVCTASLLFMLPYPLVASEQGRAQLGQLLFFDKNLSRQRNQSCASCHNPQAGFSDDRNNRVKAMASLGDDGISLGDRNTPTVSYAAFSPPFHFDSKTRQYVGGQFWDGRARDLQAQAGAPPLNPLEMAMPDKLAVIQRLQENAHYVEQFRQLYGEDVFDEVETAYSAMTESLAAFEKTDLFAPFDSKYDRYLRGDYELSIEEELGLSLFFSNNNTSCSSCHVLKGEDEAGETFTNYQYHNIGVPVNEALRQKNDHADVDKGLLDNPRVTDEKQLGKFKVPTLRNVAVTAPYMHNGVFANLQTVIKFYDQYNNPQRNINPQTGKPWRVPEVAETVNLEDLKAKTLSDRKIDALIAFLEILTDKRYEYLLE